MMKRVFAIFLTCVFLLGLLPASALAAEPDTGGLCPHHQEHSFEDCGYVEAAEEVPCDKDCADMDGDGQIDHIEGCAYKPAVEGAPCQHEHDGLCGYIEAVEGQPCGYVCPTCSMQAVNDLPMLAAGETGNLTVAGGALNTDYTYENNTLTISSSANLTISGTTTTDKIVIANTVTANVTLNNVNIDVSRTSNACAFEVTGNASCNLTLTGENTLKSGGDKAGLQVAGDATLTISEGSTGSLIATGGANSAGIGGSRWSGRGGTITINGGTVTANSSGNGAGIGGGYGGSGGTITIIDGTVNAISNSNGAGIGGGANADGGIITINGGIVNATGGKDGAGIGGGVSGSGGAITINGGKVNAKGGAYAAGIGGGGGNVGGGGTIIINGGVVNAISSSNGAGIGGGFNGPLGTFSTGNNGNAFIFASSISDQTGKESSWSGVIFEGDDGKVYGAPTLKTDATLPGGKTLTIENGKTLTVGSGTTLTNNGTIQINQGGTLKNNGTLTGSGTFTGDGDITGTKLTQAAPAANEGYTIDYAAETITVNGDYKVNTEQSFTGTDITTGTSLTNYMDRKLYIRKPENNFYAASGAAEIQISRPAAPAFSINTEAEGVAISSDYYYNTTGADYTSNIWTQGDGSLVSVQPGNSIYIYKTATASEFKSAVQTLPAPSRGVTPSVSIDYENETLNTTTAMQYASGHSVQSWESCSEDMAVNAFGWDGSEVTAQFRTAATADKYASEAQEVTIPARPATPSGLQGQNTSFAGESDGTITGLTAGTAYQISKDGGSLEDKTATGEGTITGLAAGDYQVRLKATATAFASATASVTVGSGDERTYTLTVENIAFENAAYGDAQPAAKNITISSSGNSDATISSVTVSDTSSFTIGGSGSTVMAGGSIDTWTVQPNDGLSAGEHTATITVTYNNNATAEATVRFHVTGAAQAAPANAPELDSKSYNSVTLKTVSANANGAAAQYSSDNGQTWQDSPVFTGLTPSTKYTFVVRYGAIGNYEESPASPVLEVTTEAAPVTMYSVTVNGGTGGGSYAAGDTVTITATVPSDQRFTGWTVNAGGVTVPNTNPASFTMPAQAVTVTANFQSNSGGGNSGGGGGGTTTTPTQKPNIEDSTGGNTTVAPVRPGETATIRPKPDEGYEVDKITVTDKNGKPVEVTKKPDGTYTFTQPTGKVKIEVTYKPTQPIDRPWNNPFTDVSEGDWYYEAVRFVQEQGLMNGYSDGRFGPNDTLSRAQLAQILFNKEGRPAVSGGGFNDVDSGAWYADAVTWAAENGIVGGYGNGTFGPNAPITREQLAVMLWRYSGSPAATDKELHFNDTDEISGFALDAMRWAVENGILNGYGDGRLGPQGQATRAQVAQMLKNFFEKG